MCHAFLVCTSGCNSVVIIIIIIIIYETILYSTSYNYFMIVNRKHAFNYVFSINAKFSDAKYKPMTVFHFVIYVPNVKTVENCHNYNITYRNNCTKHRFYWSK